MNTRIHDINTDGLLLHGTSFDKFGSIARYGLVSGMHFKDIKTTYDERSYYDRQRFGCPCNQDMPREGYEHLRGLIFFTVIGNVYSRKVSFRKGDDLPFGFPGYDFSILIDPQNYFSNLPSKETINSLNFQKKVHLEEDFKSAKHEKMFNYYMTLRNEIRTNLEGRSDERFEFLMTSCTPWEKFSALLITGSLIPGSVYYETTATVEEKVLSEKLKFEKLDILVDMMEKARSATERIPIYDTENNLLYAPDVQLIRKSA